MRMPQLMDGYLVRSLKIVGRLSVQVKESILAFP